MNWKGVIMESLSTPSKTMVSRIFKKVKFQNRLVGYVLHSRAGALRISLYSLEEVFTLLNESDPRIDFDELEAWIRNVISDEALADKVKNFIEMKGSLMDKNHRIRELIGGRLTQCRELQLNKNLT
jgi:hypothetical protein